MPNISFKDIVDIFLVAIVLFYCYKLMKQSRSVNIFYGILLFISFWIIISKVMEMKLLGGILDQLVSVGALAIIILFQEDIRRFFYNIGARNRAHRFLRFFRLDKRKNVGEFRNERETIFPIVMACMNMSKQHVGAGLHEHEQATRRSPHRAAERPSAWRVHANRRRGLR